ncbi:MAG TPA: hypothetical protein DEP84_29100 [Chloroflexi bacterium]|nr:hypothetical protein [Chloroflexota bacterium]
MALWRLPLVEVFLGMVSLTSCKSGAYAPLLQKYQDTGGEIAFQEGKRLVVRAVARFHLNLTIAVRSRAGRRARESAARAGGRAGLCGHPGWQRSLEQGTSG